VSRWEIDRAHRETENAVNKTTTELIVVCVFIMAFFIVILFWLSRRLSLLIVKPVNDLRAVLLRIQQDDLTGSIPTNAESSDMRVLLDTFSQLLVALRFGTESYARGNQQQAFQLFNESLVLFTTIHNKRGIGSSLNNLAAVSLSQGDFSLAISQYQQSIELAKELLQETTDYHEIYRLRRTISDREGNLVCDRLYFIRTLYNFGHIALIMNYLRNAMHFM
jgi:tetratricopeptide (TPR) repeat protein